MSSEPLNIFRRTMVIVCCLFGLPGNILTIIVCIKALCQRTINFQRKVFHLYLVEISILDTCLLLYWILDALFAYLYDIKQLKYLSLMDMSAFSCYSSYMINRLCAALCSWLIACFTLIRFINIFRQFNTIKSNIILLISLIVIFSLANSYSVIVLEYNSEEKSFLNETVSNITSKNQTRCGIRSEYADDQLTLLINILVAGVFNLALPSILILIVNIITLFFIKRIYSSQAYDKIQRRSDVLTYRSTRSTLLVISMTYTLFYLPYVIFYFLITILEDIDDTLYNLSEITYILRHVSHSVNFYAYIFTNLYFRRESVNLLRYICRPCLNYKKRQRYKKKQKTKHILIDRSPLPPPPLSRESLARKYPIILTHQNNLLHI